MLGLLQFLSIAACATAKLHHVYVGQPNSAVIHAVELDDELRSATEMGMIPASGATPSLALDHSKKYLFSSWPQNGTLTRYAVQADYSLKDEGTANIPASCNTTKFSSLHLTSSNWAPFSIFGSASTGLCSVVFSSSVSGFHTLRSKEFKGDIRSLAWSPNGRHLHALDSKSSMTSQTSIFNFYMSDDPNLSEQNGTDILSNVTNAEQMVTHPTGNMVYVVTKDTNELVTIPIQEDKPSDSTAAPSRYKILPSSLDATQYTTSSLAISSSKSSLWTLSQSTAQAVITVFSIDAATGQVINAVARAAWSSMGNIGSGQIAPAPFEGNDMIMVANSPIGIVAFLGLDKNTTTSGMIQGNVKMENDGFLEDVWMLNVKQDAAAAAPKLKSFGRIDLGLDSLGEGVWVD